ncbi:MAG TPA: ribose 5-phosphate isomerase B [Armatimonadota bacterium]|nr:ribose 5-phosphate isomerase B [Armatimonadota bacterium]
MKIAVGSDHRGYTLKQEIIRFLSEQGSEFKDFGVLSKDPADYPDIGLEVAGAVAGGEFDRGILVCSTGVGMSIAANKVPGVRAALCTDTNSALLSRKHNDANVLALGEQVTPPAMALEIVRTWLSAAFPGEERHARRVRKISDIERQFSRGGC